MNPIIIQWKNALYNLLKYYEIKRLELKYFYPKLFTFFFFLNVGCYWWAMFTAFPELTVGSVGFHYFKIQFPVGFLGALFDSLSFFVTIYIIKRALSSSSSTGYVAHLSIDLIIAVLATWWVLFVFSVSGWLISFVEAQPQLLTDRSELYQQRALSAIEEPSKNLRNIYFGIIMGVSAMIPTTIHLYMSIRSLIRVRLIRID